MSNLRKRFTKWYAKKGYGYVYLYRPYFSCPWYVQPFTILFSPSVYMYEAVFKHFDQVLGYSYLDRLEKEQKRNAYLFDGYNKEIEGILRRVSVKCQE